MFRRLFHTIAAPVANLIGILESSLFLWGLALGGLCVVGVRGHLAGRQEPRPLPIGGILIAVATILAIDLAGDISAMAWAGLGAIWLLTMAAVRAGAVPGAVAAASIPGAVVVSLAAQGEPSWVRLVVIVAVPLVGFLIDDFESRFGSRGLGVLFFGLATFGVFLAVPDTDWARVLFAVMLPVSFLAWPKVVVTMGRSGAYTSAAVIALSASEGGIGRPASVIGAMACLGLLILGPVVVRSRSRSDDLVNSWIRAPESVILAAVPQLLIVLIMSRVVAHLVSPLRSVVVVVAVFAVVFVGLMWMGGRPQRVAVGKAYDK